MAEPATIERRGAVALISLDNPPVNALGSPVRSAVLECLDEVAKDSSVGAIVITGRGRCFSAGADIREFGKPPVQPDLRALIEAIENCPKPVVAAIHDTAIGGGLELALGCDYRVGDATARLGLPEIKLGLIPGAGGTQRLPRLIGVGPALDIILSGDFVSAQKARALGLLDGMVEGSLSDGAVAFAEALIADGAPARRLSEAAVPGENNEAALAATRERIAPRSRGLIAPFRCLDSVENAVQLPFAEGMQLEREYFVECLHSDQSKAQRHLFFAERKAGKVDSLPPDVRPRPIGRAAIIGCGTMGGGIAMNFANAGIPVKVLETSKKALDAGLAKVRDNYAGSVSRKRITQAQMDTCMTLIEGVSDYEKIADADIVIEAVFEDLTLKQEIFTKLDEICKPEAILATNTSTLDVNAIAAATRRPEAVIGTHFFSPANVMKLMENVRGDKTSPDTIATVMALAKRLKKIPVLVGVCDGFVGNRMLYAYTRQANALLLEGALPQQVDKVIHEFGFPMGPFTMNDLAGLDIGWHIRQRRAREHPELVRQFVVADRICEMGRFGQKTGAGWYRYKAGSRKPLPDPEIEALIRSVSAERGIERREVSDAEILQRCMYPLINEGARILEEGIAARSSDIDVVWIYGYGFPVYRGGPMFYADNVGLKSIRDVLRDHSRTHGELLQPAPLLEHLADSGGSFGELE